MEQSQVIDHIWEILSYGGAAILGLVIKLAWDKINGLEKKTEALQSRSDNIEKNYIKRFEDMQMHMTTVKEEMVDKISELRVCLAEGYAKKSDVAEVIDKLTHTRRSK